VGRFVDIHREHLEVSELVYPSPLRYPGGKKKLATFIADAIIDNGIQGGTYIEPFAGGAGVALQMLFMEHVNNIIINDIDRSIYSFWHSVLNETDKLCKMIFDTPITIEEWERQKAVQRQKGEADFLSLGFSTFFLNRTNRSGIINGGIIGGKGQAGKWKMDVRFNKDDLIKRIQKIALYKSRIQLYNEDAIDFINAVRPTLNERTLIYFDPPYYNQGAALYANHYTHADHEELSRFIQGLECKWILTYDYTPNIIGMYHDVEKRLLTLSYTVAEKIKGSEMIAFSDKFIIPEGNYSAITIE
jgi:DNA adenine methylase